MEQINRYSFPHILCFSFIFIYIRHHVIQIDSSHTLVIISSDFRLFICVMNTMTTFPFGLSLYAQHSTGPHRAKMDSFAFPCSIIRGKCLFLRIVPVGYVFKLNKRTASLIDVNKSITENVMPFSC
jgi:hypothetical protein